MSRAVRTPTPQRRRGHPQDLFEPSQLFSVERDVSKGGSVFDSPLVSRRLKVRRAKRLEGVARSSRHLHDTSRAAESVYQAFRQGGVQRSASLPYRLGIPKTKPKTPRDDSSSILSPQGVPLQRASPHRDDPVFGWSNTFLPQQSPERRILSPLYSAARPPRSPPLRSTPNPNPFRSDTEDELDCGVSTPTLASGEMEREKSCISVGTQYEENQKEKEEDEGPAMLDLPVPPKPLKVAQIFEMFTAPSPQSPGSGLLSPVKDLEAALLDSAFDASPHSISPISEVATRQTLHANIAAYSGEQPNRNTLSANIAAYSGGANTTASIESDAESTEEVQQNTPPAEGSPRLSGTARELQFPSQQRSSVGPSTGGGGWDTTPHLARYPSVPSSHSPSTSPQTGMIDMMAGRGDPQWGANIEKPPNLRMALLLDEGSKKSSKMELKMPDSPEIKGEFKAEGLALGLLQAGRGTTPQTPISSCVSPRNVSLYETLSMRSLTGPMEGFLNLPRCSSEEGTSKRSEASFDVSPSPPPKPSSTMSLPSIPLERPSSSPSLRFSGISRPFVSSFLKQQEYHRSYAEGGRGGGGGFEPHTELLPAITTDILEHHETSFREMIRRDYFSSWLEIVLYSEGKLRRCVLAEERRVWEEFSLAFDLRIGHESVASIFSEEAELRGRMAVLKVVDKEMSGRRRVERHALTAYFALKECEGRNYVLLQEYSQRKSYFEVFFLLRNEAKQRESLRFLERKIRQGVLQLRRRQSIEQTPLNSRNIQQMTQHFHEREGVGAATLFSLKRSGLAEREAIGREGIEGEEGVLRERGVVSVFFSHWMNLIAVEEAAGRNGVVIAELREGITLEQFHTSTTKRISRQHSGSSRPSNTSRPSRAPPPAPTSAASTPTDPNLCTSPPSPFFKKTNRDSASDGMGVFNKLTKSFLEGGLYSVSSSEMGTTPHREPSTTDIETIDVEREAVSVASSSSSSSSSSSDTSSPVVGSGTDTTQITSTATTTPSPEASPSVQNAGGGEWTLPQERGFRLSESQSQSQSQSPKSSRYSGKPAICLHDLLDGDAEEEEEEETEDTFLPDSYEALVLECELAAQYREDGGRGEPSSASCPSSSSVSVSRSDVDATLPLGRGSLHSMSSASDIMRQRLERQPGGGGGGRGGGGMSQVQRQEHHHHPAPLPRRSRNDDYIYSKAEARASYRRSMQSSSRSSTQGAQSVQSVQSVSQGRGGERGREEREKERPHRASSCATRSSLQTDVTSMYDVKEDIKVEVKRSRSQNTHRVPSYKKVASYADEFSRRRVEEKWCKVVGVNAPSKGKEQRLLGGWLSVPGEQTALLSFVEEDARGVIIKEHESWLRDFNTRFYCSIHEVFLEKTARLKSQRLAQCVQTTPPPKHEKKKGIGEDPEQRAAYVRRYHEWQKGRTEAYYENLESPISAPTTPPPPPPPPPPPQTETPPSRRPHDSVVNHLTASAIGTLASIETQLFSVNRKAADLPIPSDTNSSSSHRETMEQKRVAFSERRQVASSEVSMTSTESSSSPSSSSSSEETQASSSIATTQPLSRVQTAPPRNASVDEFVMLEKEVRVKKKEGARRKEGAGVVGESSGAAAGVGVFHGPGGIGAMLLQAMEAREYEGRVSLQQREATFAGMFTEMSAKLRIKCTVASVGGGGGGGGGDAHDTSILSQASNRSFWDNAKAKRGKLLHYP